jgi:peptide/nickel transport system substrate-binding protein
MLRAGTGIIPKHIWENEDLNKSKYNSYPVGTGPWKVKEWVRMDHMTFVANELYHKGRPYLDKIVTKVIPDATVTFAALEKGDVDYFPIQGVVGGIPFEQVDHLKKNPNLVVKIWETASQQQLWFRVDKPPFKDIRVRRAIAHSIDREFIVKKILAGYGIVVHSQVPPSIGWAYNPDVRKYEYDTKKAEKLLDEAGFPRKKDGVRFKTTIYGTPGSRRVLSEVLKEQFYAIGIDAKLEIADWTTYISKIRQERSHDGMWSIIALPKVPTPDETTMYVLSDQIKKGGINPSFYKNSRIDELVAQGKVASDTQESKKIYYEYQKILAEDLPTLPLYLASGVDIWNKKFMGFYPMQWGGGSITCLEKVWKVK